ncbi:aspartic peptidase domain-containing protein [Russula vinacea]|nr:aspartic peptidase domain-containing protein [Russula vinacea]
MASFSTLCISILVLLLDLNFATPLSSPERVVTHTKRSFDLPIRRTALSEGSWKRGTDSGSTGLGDFFDFFYMVPITIGELVTAVILDTGSSDLWVVSDACHTAVCEKTNMPPYPLANVTPAGGSCTLLYGDSSTGTHAIGPVAQDVGAIAGLSMSQQPFVAVYDTNSTSVRNGSNGIFGLGFPSGRYSPSDVQAAVINARFNNPSTTDDFILGTADEGPLLSRLAMSGALEQPMFSVTLQRDIIDVSGSNGALTVGRLPDGIDNSSLTWVPVYPFRWEVPIEGVILDDRRKDLSVDPRDFMSQNTPGDATTCVVDNVVATDPPSLGALFSWSLGDPFFKSNLVAFYYGNLTHPSLDPPRIGFLSMVPDNADSIVQSDDSRAQSNGGLFGSTSQAAPTSAASNVLIATSDGPLPSITATSSSPTSTSAKSSASRTFGRSTNVGYALCMILLPTFFRTMFLFV